MPKPFPTDSKGARAREKADRAPFEPTGEPRNPGTQSASPVPAPQHGAGEFPPIATKTGYSLAKAGRESTTSTPKPSLTAPAKPIDH